jgi:hypothetical protein
MRERVVVRACLNLSVLELLLEGRRAEDIDDVLDGSAETLERLSHLVGLDLARRRRDGREDLDLHRAVVDDLGVLDQLRLDRRIGGGRHLPQELRQLRSRTRREATRRV